MDTAIVKLCQDPVLKGGMVLQGGSQVTDFHDELSDYEYSIWLEQDIGAEARMDLYRKNGYQLLHLGQPDPDRLDFGFADKLLKDGQSLDLIWLNQNRINCRIRNLGQNPKDFWADLALWANIQRGRWLSEKKISTSDQVSRQINQHFLEQTLTMKMDSHFLKELIKLKMRQAWPQLMAELSFLFQNEALTACLQNQIYPLGEKWLLHEYRKLNPLRAMLWCEIFENPKQAQLTKIFEKRGP